MTVGVSTVRNTSCTRSTSVFLTIALQPRLDFLFEAEAKSEVMKIIAQGAADAQYKIAEALARGQAAGLTKRAEGYKAVLYICGGSQDAYRMMLLDHLDTLAENSAIGIGNRALDGSQSKGGAVPDFIKDALPPTLDILKDVVSVGLHPEKQHEGQREPQSTKKRETHSEASQNE